MEVAAFPTNSIEPHGAIIVAFLFRDGFAIGVDGRASRKDKSNCRHMYGDNEGKIETLGFNVRIAKCNNANRCNRICTRLKDMVGESQELVPLIESARKYMDDNPVHTKDEKAELLFAGFVLGEPMMYLVYDNLKKGKASCKEMKKYISDRRTTEDSIHFKSLPLIFTNGPGASSVNEIMRDLRLNLGTNFDHEKALMCMRKALVMTSSSVNSCDGLLQMVSCGVDKTFKEDSDHAISFMLKNGLEGDWANSIFVNEKKRFMQATATKMVQLIESKWKIKPDLDQCLFWGEDVVLYRVRFQANAYLTADETREHHIYFKGEDHHIFLLQITNHDVVRKALDHSLGCFYFPD